MMIRRFLPGVLTLLMAAPLSAQVDDLQMRVDRSTNPDDPDNVPEVTVESVEDGFRVETGPAVVLWHPENTASGSYDLSGTFTLQEPSSHVNYYGLVFGAEDLESSSQNYLYFLVAQNGTYLIKHRANDEAVHDIVGRTEHEAVNAYEDGPSVNELEVRVRGDHIHFVVNGTEVHNQPKTGMASQTDGIWGVRVNHVIPGVVIEDLGLGE